MSKEITEKQSSPKKFYFRFAMKNNFMNTNSTRFSEQFKQKIFNKIPHNTDQKGNPNASLVNKTDSSQIGKYYRKILTNTDTKPRTRRFKTIPRESKLMMEYLLYRKKVQGKVDNDYKLNCKVLKLQALSKEISNKLQRQRKNLGLLKSAKKSTKKDFSKEDVTNHIKNIASVQGNMEKGICNSLINQQEIEEQLTQALENHLLKKKRTIHEDQDTDWRNSCPVEMVPKSLALALKDNLPNDSRFSVQNSGLLDKAVTKRKKSKQMIKMKLEDEAKKGGKNKGEERRELGSWAKEKIKLFRNQYEMGKMPNNNKEDSDRMWVTDAFQNLKTDKSEKKNRDAKGKKSANYLNSKKLVPQKKSQYNKNPNPKLYYKSNKTLNQFPKPKRKKWSHKNKRNNSNLNTLNLSKNISHAKREKEFWNRLGSGKINSRMTRSFFLSKQGKSAIPNKPIYKKTKSKKVINPKSKSALKRDLFKKGSSSFGNLFSEFRANYKHYKKPKEKSHNVMISPCLSTKVITKGRNTLFNSKNRSRVNKRKKKETRKKENGKKKKDRRLPAISFRTMQEERFYSKYPNGRHNQLEDGLNAKMLKILSKMENLKETVKAEKQKLIYSGQKSKMGINSSDFLKKSHRTSNKKEAINFSNKSKKTSASKADPSERMPNNLTFSGPQKLKHLGQLSTQKNKPKISEDNLDNEKRELKLIPMSELTNREKMTPELDLLSTFKNKKGGMDIQDMIKGSV